MEINDTQSCIEIVDLPTKVPLRFCKNGLNEVEQAVVLAIGSGVIKIVGERYKHVLERCNWFAEFGYEILAEEIGSYDIASDPQIKGDDDNPFNQHYWLVFGLGGNGRKREVIIDPIFGYLGLYDEAGGGFCTDNMMSAK